MKDSRKWLPILAVIMIAAFTITACGSNNNKGSQSSSPSASGQIETTQPQSSEEKTTVTMFHAGGFAPANPIPTNKDEDPLHKMLEESANIDLQITFVPNDQAKQKLNTMVASGDIPDLIYMSDRPTAVQYFDQGVIADIDTILNDYPALKDNYPEQVWSALKYQGKTLGTPGYELACPRD